MIRSIRSVPILVCALLSATAFAALRAPRTVGLKNFREIASSLEESTGIPAKTPSVAATYRKVASRLPVRGDVKELGSPTVLALVELSGAFCNELVQKESQLEARARRYFLFVDFEKGPEQFSPAAWSEITKDLSVAFWQREPNAEEKSLYAALLAKFSALGSSEPTVTRQVLQGACVQAGSSLAFLTNGT